MADLIDRQAAIYEILRLTRYETVRDLYEATVADKYDDYKDGIMDAIDVIVGLTSVQPEKTGRWEDASVVNKYTGEARRVRRCSECGAAYFHYADIKDIDDTEPNYCPNCGTKMEEVREWDD